MTMPSSSSAILSRSSAVRRCRRRSRIARRLLFGEAIGTVGPGAAPARFLDQRDQRQHVFRRPAARHHLGARRRRIGRLADQRDHRIDIGDGDGEAQQGMRALARLAQKIDRAPRDHLLAEIDEGRDDVAQAHQQRPAAVERQHVDAEARLQRRVAIELVQHDIGHRVALQLDDDAHAVAIAFVAQIGDALDGLVLHQLGDALDHARLVHLIRNLGDDDRLAILADLLDLGLAAHDDRAAAERVGGMDAGAAEDDAAGREIRARHDLHQLFDGDLAIVDIGDAGIDHFAEIMRRDVGRHADGDARAAVDEDVRDSAPGATFGSWRLPSKFGWKSTVSLSMSSSSASAARDSRNSV